VEQLRHCRCRELPLLELFEPKHHNRYMKIFKHFKIFSNSPFTTVVVVLVVGFFRVFFFFWYCSGSGAVLGDSSGSNSSPDDEKIRAPLDDLRLRVERSGDGVEYGDRLVDPLSPSSSAAARGDGVRYGECERGGAVT
jgi:hypothetical protein